MTPMPPPGMDTVGLNPPGLSVVVEVGRVECRAANGLGWSQVDGVT